MGGAWRRGAPAGDGEESGEAGGVNPSAGWEREVRDRGDRERGTSTN